MSARAPLSWRQVHELQATISDYRGEWVRHAGRLERALVTADPGADPTDLDAWGNDEPDAYQRLLEAIDGLGPAGP